jgi:hypothetical protein
MNEDQLIRHFQTAGRSIPLRPLNYDAVVSRGKREARRFQLLAIAGMLGTAAVAVSVAPAINDLFTREIRNPLPPTESDVTERQVRPLIESFAEGMRSRDVEGTWKTLSSRAQESIGGIGVWSNELKEVEYLFSWITRRPHEVFVSPLSGVSAVATFSEKEGNLVTTVPVLVRPSTLRGTREAAADLPSVDLVTEKQVSLTPEAPLFMAGSTCIDGPCPADGMPVITDKQRFSVFLKPRARVQEVHFSLGGDEWVSEGNLDEINDGVRATVDYDGSAAPGETVFVVSIKRPDGAVEAYGYRVQVEAGS